MRFAKLPDTPGGTALEPQRVPSTVMSGELHNVYSCALVRVLERNDSASVPLGAHQHQRAGALLTRPSPHLLIAHYFR